MAPAHTITTMSPRGRWHPCRGADILRPMTGGVATLNHRLQAVTPPVSILQGHKWRVPPPFPDNRLSRCHPDHHEQQDAKSHASISPVIKTAVTCVQESRADRPEAALPAERQARQKKQTDPQEPGGRSRAIQGNHRARPPPARRRQENACRHTDRREHPHAQKRQPIRRESPV